MSEASRALGLPDSILSSIPLRPAPPGEVSNLQDPYSNGKILVIIPAICVAISFIAFCVRAYAKVAIIRRFTWDDVTLAAGLALEVVTYAGNVLGVVRGPFGKHIWNVSLQENFSNGSMIGAYIGSIFLTPALGLLKLSILIMLYQIFSPLRWMKPTIWITGLVIGAFYAGVSIYLFVILTPRPGVPFQKWYINPDIEQSVYVGLPTGVFGLAADIFLFVLPIPAILRLHMPIRRKYNVLPIFGSGILACVASAVNVYYRYLQAKYGDHTWVTVATSSLIHIEMSAGILCVCMPSIAKVYNHDAQEWSRWPSQLRSGLLRLRSRISVARMGGGDIVSVPPSHTPSFEMGGISGKTTSANDMSSRYDLTGRGSSRMSVDELAMVKRTEISISTEVRSDEVLESYANLGLYYMPRPGAGPSPSPTSRP